MDRPVAHVWIPKDIGLFGARFPRSRPLDLGPDIQQVDREPEERRDASHHPPT